MKRLSLIAVCLAASCLPSIVRAELGGTTISPPLKQVVLSTSGVTPVSFSVSNNSDHLQTYQLQAIDFKSLSESGGVAFLGQNVTGSKFGLAKWLQLPNKQITLQPRETRTITANIPADIAPGGHYCALLLAAASDDAKTGDNKLSLQQVSSALVFAIKTGGAKYALDFDRFVGLQRLHFEPPLKLRLRLYNRGNVQAVPRGIVQITDPLGRVVEQGTINTETGMVLPESFRQYVVVMNQVGQSWLLGRYQVKALYRYEGTEKVQTASRSIWIISGFAIGVLALLLVLLAAGLAYLWSRRRTTS